MKRSALVASKLTYAASQGVILVALARLGGAEAAGQYALLVALISPLFLLTNLRVQDILSTRSGDADLSEYVRLTRTSNLLGSVLCVAVAFVFVSGDLLLAVLGFTIAKYFEALSRGAYGYAQGAGRVRAAVLSNLGHSLFPTAALIAGMVAWGRLGPSLALVALAWGLQYLVFERAMFGSGAAGREWELSGHWELMVSLIPLGASAMLLSINQSVVRVALSMVHSVEVLGIFATVAYTTRIGAVVARGLAEAEARQVSGARGPQELWRATLRPLRTSVVLGVGMAALMVSIGPTLWPLVFGDEFRPDRLLLATVGLAGIFVYATTAISMSVVASGRHQGQLVAMMAGLTVTAILIVPCVSTWGSVGAAGAWAAGEAVRLALMMRQLSCAAIGRPHESSG